MTLQKRYNKAHAFRKHTVLKTAEGRLALGPGLLWLGEQCDSFEDAHSRVQETIRDLLEKWR